MNYTNTKTVHSNCRSTLHLVVSFSVILLMSTPLFARYPDSPGVLEDTSKAESNDSVQEELNSAVLVQSAIDYARGHYGIKVTIAGSLLAEYVPTLADPTVPPTQWISRVFKRFDKIVYYNDQGDVESLKIIGIKNTQGTAQVARATFNTPLPDAIDALTGELPTGVIIADSSDTELAQNGVIISTAETSQNEGLPAGVVFNTSDSPELPPEGVQIADPQTPDTDIPEGVQISDSQSPNDSAPEGVELHQ